MAPKNSEQFKKIREGSKKNIASAALALFAARGYQNVSVSQIARQAGVSKGLMYNYFKSKEALLSYVVDKMIMDMGSVMEEKGDEPPLEKVENMIRLTFQQLKDKKEFWASVLPVLTQHVAGHVVQEKLRIFFTGFIDVTEALFKEAGLSHARLEAYKLGALIDGIALDCLFLFREDYPLDEMEQFIIDQYQILAEQQHKK